MALSPSYGVEDGTGAPVRHEATGDLQPITITVDNTAVLGGSDDLPEGTLMVPSSVTGNYIVADTAEFPAGNDTQEPSQIVILSKDLHNLSAGGDVQVAAWIRGTWTSNYYLNNGPLAEADAALFNQRLILRWDGQP